MKKKIVLLASLALMVSACQCGNGQKTEASQTPATTQEQKTESASPVTPAQPKKELTEEQKKKVEEILNGLSERVDSILDKAVKEGKLTEEQVRQLKEKAIQEETLRIMEKGL